MNKTLLGKLMAILFALALVASACGGSDNADDDDVDSGGGDTEEQTDLGDVDEETVDDAMAAAAEDDGAMEDDAPKASSIEELEAQWAEERAAIVADIKANGYGVTDGVLTGPGGWTVDLSNCPADWSDTEGVVDGTVTIGLSIAQSGTLAVYGNIATGMGAYFDYINENGGVGPDGIQIALDARDDAYDSALTQEYIEEFLGTDTPFAVQTLGTPNTFSVRDRLNAECVPQPMVMTGHPAWGDPVNFPWTTGLQLNYFTEGTLWGSWIEQNLADKAPVKVAALVGDNDFGLAYEKAFLNYAAGSDIIGDVEVVRHDISAATLTNETTTLAATDPDVYIVMTAGSPCTIAFQEAARAGITETAEAYWAPSVCANTSFLGPAEEAGEGWLAFPGGWKDTAEVAAREDDPWLAFNAELLESAGLDSGIGLLGTGVGEFGWSQVQALMIAAELDGGLTRTNYMLAIRSLDMSHPALIDGISFSNDGAVDAYLVEGTHTVQWDATEKKGVQIGGVIDLNGSSGTCVWSTESGCG